MILIDCEREPVLCRNERGTDNKNASECQCNVTQKSIIAFGSETTHYILQVFLFLSNSMIGLRFMNTMNSIIVFSELITKYNNNNKSAKKYESFIPLLYDILV